MRALKPRLTFLQILSMNVGFFGIQFSFGLQQSSMSPIYKYLGAHDAILPLLWLAGPITGLLVQPLIGAFSDRTVTRWGRRRPYFFVGAMICSIVLFAMPFSPTLWVAATLLWILDAANNVTMEPYRAFVSDRLDHSQHTLGFLTQSAFTGLSQTLAYLTPSLLILLGMNATAATSYGIPETIVAAFMIGGVLSVVTVSWSAWTTPELPPSTVELERMRTISHSAGATVREIYDAWVEMPIPMRQLAMMMIFQWYAMFAYWQYIPIALSHSLFGTTNTHSAGFTQAVLINGQIGGFYNFVAFLSAFALVPLARRMGIKHIHALCLTAAGVGMFVLPWIHNRWLLLLPMVGVGLAWASMMGNPYAMLTSSIPAERNGIYMGLFNAFIVLPMLIESLTIPLFYNHGLGGNPDNVIRLAGVFLAIAALLVMRVRIPIPDVRPVLEADS